MEVKKYRRPHKTIEEKINTRFGSVKEYIKIYITKLLEDNTITTIGARTRIREDKMANYFEFTSENFQGKNSIYAKFFSELMGTHLGFIYQGNFEEDAAKMLEEAELNERSQDIIYSNYTLGRPKKSFTELANQYDISRARIGQIIDAEMKKMKMLPSFKEMKGKTMKIEDYYTVLADVLSLEDLIVSEEDHFSPEKREQILVGSIAKRITMLSIRIDMNYLSKILAIREEINQAEISDENKEKLRKSLEKKTKEIAENNLEILLIIINKRILKYNLNVHMNQPIKESDFSKSSYGAITKAGIEKIGDLVKLSRSEIHSIEGLAARHVGQVYGKIESLGLSIPQNMQISIAEHNHIQPDVFKSQKEYLIMLLEEIDEYKFNEATTELLKSRVQRNLDEILEQEARERELLMKEKEDQISFIEHQMLRSVNDEMMETPIEKLGLPTRAYNTFKNSNITTMGKILELCKNDIATLKNMGERAMNGVMDIIKEHGYEIPEDDYITIFDYNIFKIEHDDARIDVVKVAENIKSADITEEQKSELLDRLYKISVERLKNLYVELDKEARNYVDLIKLAEIIPEMGRPEPVHITKSENEENLRQIVEIQAKALKEIEDIEGMI